MSCPRHRRGFTLLEMLLATGLLALALVLAYGALRTAAAGARSGEALIEATDEVRLVQEFLRRQLSHAMPLVYETLEDSGQIKRFEGDDRRLRFVAPMPGYLSRGGPHVQWLELVDGRDGLELHFDHALLNGFDPQQPRAEDARDPVLLLERIAEARFEYRSFDDTGELDDWTDAWETPDALPLMVRLSLRFEGGDRRRWSLLEIPLRTAGTTSSVSRARRLQPVRPGERQ